MAISKSAAFAAQINVADAAMIQEIEGLLDARISQTGGTDVHVWKPEWNSQPPNQAVLAALKEKYEAPGMGWIFSVQPDRDGPILWLK